MVRDREGTGAARPRAKINGEARRGHGRRGGGRRRRRERVRVVRSQGEQGRRRDRRGCRPRVGGDRVGSPVDVPGIPRKTGPQGDLAGEHARWIRWHGRGGRGRDGGIRKLPRDARFPPWCIQGRRRRYGRQEGGARRELWGLRRAGRHHRHGILWRIRRGHRRHQRERLPGPHDKLRTRSIGWRRAAPVGRQGGRSRPGGGLRLRDLHRRIEGFGV
mmetsp:Transcript_16986/g.40687  ORF Transcript_16986/g.40687 Transcript_16986/m.40687 type:complete len:217 (+) Transcript_16986:2835-3485(+)